MIAASWAWCRRTTWKSSAALLRTSPAKPQTERFRLLLLAVHVLRTAAPLGTLRLPAGRDPQGTPLRQQTRAPPACPPPPTPAVRVRVLRPVQYFRPRRHSPRSSTEGGRAARAYNPALTTAPASAVFSQPPPLSPRRSPKPKLAPKPAIRPKPTLSPKPSVPAAPAESLAGRTVSPAGSRASGEHGADGGEPDAKDRKVFADINAGLSLDNIVQAELEKAKSEGDRSRGSSFLEEGKQSRSGSFSSTVSEEHQVPPAPSDPPQQSGASCSSVCDSLGKTEGFSASRNARSEADLRRDAAADEPRTLSVSHNDIGDGGGVAVATRQNGGTGALSSSSSASELPALSLSPPSAPHLNRSVSDRAVSAAAAAAASKAREAPFTSKANHRHSMPPPARPIPPPPQSGLWQAPLLRQPGLRARERRAAAQPGAGGVFLPAPSSQPSPTPPPSPRAHPGQPRQRQRGQPGSDDGRRGGAAGQAAAASAVGTPGGVRSLQDALAARQGRRRRQARAAQAGPGGAGKPPLSSRAAAGRFPGAVRRGPAATGQRGAGAVRAAPETPAQAAEVPQRPDALQPRACHW